MTFSDEYAPFLNWNPNHPATADQVGYAFISLVSMVKDSYIFDEELLRKASAPLMEFLEQSAVGCFRKWTCYGAESMGKGKQMLQTLEQEGSRDDLEQILLHEKSTIDGSNVRRYSFRMANRLEADIQNSSNHHFMDSYISSWMIEGTEKMCRGDVLLWILHQEGFGDDDDLIEPIQARFYRESPDL
ncbi:hypothetical protein BLNAU_18034 [Blattamonas nauphoetae]|uniref:Uncharacterized protein n=1 Tax=Blattamonas nauphoetae TaxID=2049346 RepID=A0ABQ9X5N7_9EUKA|nr:hypothetical protein BLNAU_18034 [Blattamonas nauphoetae]